MSADPVPPRGRRAAAQVEPAGSLESAEAAMALLQKRPADPCTLGRREGT